MAGRARSSTVLFFACGLAVALAGCGDRSPSAKQRNGGATASNRAPDRSPMAAVAVNAAMTELQSGEATEGRAAAILGHRLIVVGMETRPSNAASRIFVARLGQNRQLDTTFGDRGTTYIELPEGDVTSVVADEEHGLGVAGTAVTSDHRRDAFTVRLNTSGHIDSAYGTNGIAWAKLPSEATDVRIFRQGKALIVAGNIQGPSVAIRRLTADGQLDHTFGVSGRLDVPLGRGTYLTSSKGELWVAGAGLNSQGAETGDGLLMAFTANGQMKTTFGQAGVTATDDVVRLGRIDGQDRILGIIDHFDEENPGYSLIRLMPSGAADPAFGKGGTTDVVRGGNPYVNRIALGPSRIDLLVEHRTDSSTVEILDERGSTIGQQRPEGPHQFVGSDIGITDGTVVVFGTNRRGQGDFDPRYAAVWWPS